MRYENIDTACDLMIKRDKRFDNDLISPVEIMFLLLFLCVCFVFVYFLPSCSAWANASKEQ